MATLVAPLVAQLSVLLEPELMLSGWAANELIVGAEPFPEGVVGETAELQPASKAQKNRKKTSAPRFSPKDLISGELDFLLQKTFVETIKFTPQLLSSAFEWNFRLALPAATQYTEPPVPNLSP